jgi:hypothetical protein
MPSDSVGLASVDFSTFVVSLASNAMMHLGEAVASGSEAGQLNLPLAKQTIDIIGMLQDKTAGNLTEEEEKLLKGVLYQVRMAYTEHGKD